MTDQGIPARLCYIMQDQPEPWWIKVHFGRTKKCGSYLSPVLFASLQRPATFIDTNTLYGGERAVSEEHQKLAERHGFSPVRIVEDNELSLPGTVLNVAHVTGHKIMGLEACIKNLGMGLASRDEKMWVHGIWQMQGAALHPKGKHEAQAYRLGKMACRVERRCHVVNVAIADEVTRLCDCMGDTNHRDVVWRGLEMFEGGDALTADRAVWQRFRAYLQPFTKPGVVDCQFLGYEQEQDG